MGRDGKIFISKRRLKELSRVRVNHFYSNNNLSIDTYVTILLNFQVENRNVGWWLKKMDGGWQQRLRDIYYVDILSSTLIVIALWLGFLIVQLTISLSFVRSHLAFLPRSCSHLLFPFFLITIRKFNLLKKIFTQRL